MCIKRLLSCNCDAPLHDLISKMITNLTFDPASMVVSIFVPSPIPITEREMEPLLTLNIFRFNYFLPLSNLFQPKHRHTQIG